MYKKNQEIVTDEKINICIKENLEKLNTTKKQIDFLNKFIIYLFASLKTEMDLELGYSEAQLILIEKVLNIRNNLWPIATD